MFFGLRAVKLGNDPCILQYDLESDFFRIAVVVNTFGNFSTSRARIVSNTPATFVNAPR